ncbi:hypothetical protein R2281_003854 [Cronobacter dublinensis]|nr:hypothetical protein [Cronobacter dublinensis]
MNTISNVTRYRAGLDEDGIVCHREKEDGRWVKYEDYEQLEKELLALRKERARAEPFVCQKCGNTGLADSGGVQPWGEPILIDCECTAPSAPGADDNSLPYDPQIAEYEQMMEAELKAAARTAYKVKSELSQMAEKLVRDTTALAVTLSAETDTTPQQFESLAFKSVAPEGWKLVPIELTKEMLKQIHPFAEATCLDCGNQVVAHCADNVTASWNDMLAVAPEPCK